MDHALDRHTQAEAPAAGWIEELAARDGVSGREYRFIRPVVMVTKAGGVMVVKRAGLTNAPAITLQALCAVEEDPVNTEADAASVIDALREALGAPPDMTVSEQVRRACAIIAAAASTRTDTGPTKEMASSCGAQLAELLEDRAEAALERARASGKRGPAMEGWPPPTFAPSRHGKLARCAGQPRRAGCRPPHRGAGGAMPNASPSAPSSGLSRAGCRRDRSRFLPS